jgi:uncharacterized protein YggE
MSAPVVTVRGEAQLEGRPDLAALNFSTHDSGNSAERVGAELAEASHHLREVIDTHGQAIEKHSTSGVHVAPVFRSGPGTRVQGFRGLFSAELVVRDFAMISDIVFSLARIAGSQIDGPYWSLRHDNPLYRQVRLAAIDDARRRADDYAAAFGATLVDLVEVSDLEGGLAAPRGLRHSAMAFAKGAEEPPEFDFEPALQTVTGQVTVRFTLTTPDLSA